jgi:hypothetical protein
MLGVVIKISRSPVVERPRVGNRFTHLMARGYVEGVNQKPDRGLRGK